MEYEYAYSPWYEVADGSFVEAVDKHFMLDTGPNAVYYRIVTPIPKPNPKKEFVVGKWYKAIATSPLGWLRCVGIEGEFGWLSEHGQCFAYRYSTSYIDWSVAPRDEHP